MSTLSIFERQPAEIRNAIYEQLLDIKYCKQPMDKEGVIKYRFYPAILQTNKKIYQEAHSILYGRNGPITTVAFYADTAYDLLRLRRIPFHETSYTQSIYGRQMHIIVKPWFLDHNKMSPQTFVLCGHGIDRFITALRLFCFTHNVGDGIHYEFRCEPYKSVLSRPTFDEATLISLQKKHLDPFLYLRTVKQTCKVTGILDKVYEKRFLEQLTDPILWLRGEAWVLYELLHQMHINGNDSFISERDRLAAIQYNDIVDAMRQVAISNPDLLETDLKDNGYFQKSMRRLVTVSRLNMLLIHLIHISVNSLLQKGVSLNGERLISSCKGSLEITNQLLIANPEPFGYPVNPPKVITGEIYRIQGFLRAVVGDTISQVLESFNNSLRFLHEDKKVEVRKSIAIVVKAFSRGGFSKRDFASLFQYLPQKPFQVKPFTKAEGETVLDERYLLSKVNYKGPLFEDRIFQRVEFVDGKEKPSSPNLVYCQDILKKIENDRAEFSRENKLKDFCIYILPTGTDD